MKRAFTLIELLVVIAIIAILAAILFPVFAQAKSAAKKTASLSNIKQNALGVTMYNADADDAMPRALSLGGYPVSPAPASDFAMSAAQADEANGYWASSVQPYIKSLDLYKDGASKDLNPYGYPTRAKRFGYSFNAYLNLASATGVSAPAKAIMLWMGTGPQNLVGYAHSFPQPNTPGGYPTTNDYRFQRSGATCTSYGGLNFGGGVTTTAWDYRVYGNTSLLSYVDGHARSVNVDSPEYPWILDKATGKPKSLWVNTEDSRAGCTYFSVLAPTVE